MRRLFVAVFFIILVGSLNSCGARAGWHKIKTVEVDIPWIEQGVAQTKTIPIRFSEGKGQVEWSVTRNFELQNWMFTIKVYRGGSHYSDEAFPKLTGIYHGDFELPQGTYEIYVLYGGVQFFRLTFSEWRVSEPISLYTGVFIGIIILSVAVGVFILWMKIQRKAKTREKPWEPVIISETSKFCPMCGHSIKPHQKFCGNCGSPLTRTL